MSDQPSLRISEIFLSLQGESSRVGLPTVFVRLTGCPLRCQYCDTAYAFSGGELQTLDQIIAQVDAYDVPYVTVTGGEPLAQKGSVSLLEKLSDRGFKVSLETSGAMDVSGLDQRVKKVMDLKTPASLESDKNDYNNLQHLQSTDELKFVICDRKDYEWACETLKKYELEERCEILFSPVVGGEKADQFKASDLADWIIEDRLTVRFQVQLHKILWGDGPGR